MRAELDPASGGVSIESSEVQNNGTSDVLMESAAFTGAEGVSGTWTVDLSGASVALGADGVAGSLGDAEVSRGSSTPIAMSTTFSGFAAGKMVDKSLGSMTLTFKEKVETFAVYSEDDKSLTFYKRGGKPRAGDRFYGKAASRVYEGFEANAYDPYWSNPNKAENTAPWADIAAFAEKAVIADDGIKPASIAGWFTGFGMLKDVSGLSKLETSACTSAEAMFAHCTALESLDLSGMDTSSVTNFFAILFCCESLKSIDLEGVDTSNATKLQDFFNRCSSLSSVDVSGFQTGKCERFNGMFYDCRSLSSLDLSGFDTSRSRSFRWMFTNCSTLAELDLSSFSAASAENDAYMFDGCTGLRQVTLGPDFSWVGTDGYLPAPSQEHIDGADGKWYDAATGAAYAPVEVPNGAGTYVAVNPRSAFAVYSADDRSFNLYKRMNVPAVGDTFEGKTVTKVFTRFETSYSVKWDSVCADIKSVTVVDAGIAPKSTSDWFYNCKNLASVDLGKLDMSGVREMDGMFSGCMNLASIDLSQVGAGNIASMMSAFSSCTALKAIDLSGLTTTSSTDMRGAFSICYELTEITLGQGFVWGAENAKPPSNKTGTKWKADGDGALYSSSELPSGKADTYRLVEVAPTEPPKPIPETAFAVYSADDGSLNLYKRMDVPSAGDTFEGKTVTKVFTRFETSYSVKWDSVCADIKSVTVVDAGIKPKSTSEWFLNCRSLVSVDLGKLDMSRVREMARMFENCDKLTSIGLSQVGSGNIEMMSSAFNNCTALKSIDLSGLTTSSSTYMTSAFTSCYELTEITLGQGFVWTRGDADLPKETASATFGVQWKADSDGSLYSPSEIPSGKADTYRRIPVEGPSVPDKPDIPSKQNVPDSSGSGSSVAATVEAAVSKDASAWTLDDHQIAAGDISAKGEASLSYARAKAELDDGQTWTVKLTDGTEMPYWIVGVLQDGKANGSGKAELTFQIDYESNG